MKFTAEDYTDIDGLIYFADRQDYDYFFFQWEYRNCKEIIERTETPSPFSYGFEEMGRLEFHEARNLIVKYLNNILIEIRENS